MDFETAVKDLSQEDIDAKAISIIKEEVRMWQDASVWVTNNIAFQMRNVIDKCRQNYFGVFSKKENRNGTKNIWDPLTEIMVDSVVYNIDLDPKDINVRAKNPNHIGSANVCRMTLKDKLHEVGFGEILDDIERFGSIDGTAVLKTFKGINPRTGKVELRSYWVDLRNFYIDPNATNIQETGAVNERAIMNLNEVRGYKKLGWRNVDEVVGNTKVPVYNDLIAESRGETPLVEIYERWGLMPKFLLTGKDEDKEEYVEGHIIVSNLDTKPLVHVIRENPSKDSWKPYEEWWFKKLANRWYGRGIGEMLFSHQLYANLVANMRKNVNLIKGTGLYEIRKGSGIKQSDLQGLVEGGSIMVNQIGADIAPFQDRNFAYDQSIAESDRLMAQASKLTGANDLVQGNMPSTTSATTATIQNLNTQSRFEFLREGLGRFIQRVIERHYLPIIKEMFNNEELVRVTGDASFLQDLDESIVNRRINEGIIKFVMKTGAYPTPEMIDNQRQVLMNNLQILGSDRFVKDMKQIFDPKYDISVDITNEEVDYASKLTNIKDVLMNLSQISPGIDTSALLEDWLDMLGLNGARYFKKASQQVAPPQQLGGVAPQPGPASLQAPTDTMEQSARAVANGQTA